jgi:tRNA dimethylallyltransferase
LVESVVEVGSEPLLVVLLGPTASGKTSLSLALARQFHGEIVSCDSVAVYQGLEIGSAKPSPEEQSEIPHHMIDVVPPDVPYTAGDYSRAARVAIAGIAARGKLPIVTGGAGLYLHALLAGLFAGPSRSAGLRSRLQRRAETRGPLYLHRILARLDPVSARRIHVNDVPKAMRAIEVSLAGRQPMSEAWKSGRDPLTGYRILRIGLAPEREKLYQRIDARARAMFDQGLIEETKALLARFCPSNHQDSTQQEKPPALNSLGYRQAGEYLGGMLTREEAFAAASLGHRNYAKRQVTWFRREPGVAWLHGFGDDPAIQAEAARLVARGDTP